MITVSLGKTSMRKISPVALLPGLAFFIFVMFALANAGKSFTADESWFVIDALDHLSSGAEATMTLIYGHTPLYPIITGFLMGVFKTPAALKVFGAVVGLASMTLMWLLGRACGVGKSRAALAVLLLGMSPLFIQGSMLLDIDNTLVVLFLLAGLLALFKEKWLLLAAALTLLLWVKLTASLPLLLVFFAWGLWGVFRGERRGAQVLLAICAGLAAFLLSFYVYCYLDGFPFGMPFSFLYGAFFSKKISSDGGGLQQVVQFLLWSGPAFFLLWLSAAVRAFRSGKPDLDMLAALLSLVIGAGYLFVGGTPFGFPKYQVPAFVLGCWLVSGLAADALNGWFKPRYALVILAGAAVVAAAGDPLYTLRFLIRGALASGHGTGGYIPLLAVQAATPLLLTAVFWFLGRKFFLSSGKAVFAALSMACFSHCLGADLLQSKSYNTLYTYGSTGVHEAAQLASSALKEKGKGFFPAEITASLRLKGFDVEAVKNKFWSDETALKAAASDPEGRIVLYGIPFNTLDQIRLLEGPGVSSAFIAAGWRKVSAGSYKGWTRAEAQ